MSTFFLDYTGKKTELESIYNDGIVGQLVIYYKDKIDSGVIFGDARNIFDVFGNLSVFTITEIINGTQGLEKYILTNPLSPQPVTLSVHNCRDVYDLKAWIAYREKQGSDDSLRITALNNILEKMRKIEVTINFKSEDGKVSIAANAN